MDFVLISIALQETFSGQQLMAFFQPSSDCAAEAGSENPVIDLE